ncbi:hypothetical protein ACQJBY_005003 [Aegilops geniculata]
MLHRSPIACDDVHHLLHLFYLSVALPQTGDRQQHSRRHRRRSDELLSELPQWIPCAKELEEAGVRFRKRKDATSFMDVRFARGVLEIRQLELNDSSESLFRNLIAFEQTYVPGHPAGRLHLHRLHGLPHHLGGGHEDPGPARRPRQPSQQQKGRLAILQRRRRAGALVGQQLPARPDGRREQIQEPQTAQVARGACAQLLQQSLGDHVGACRPAPASIFCAADILRCLCLLQASQVIKRVSVAEVR